MRHDDEISNPSSNPTFAEILAVSRRDLMRSIGALALAVVGGPREMLAQSAGSALLGFRPWPCTAEDRITVPAGYTAQVLYAWGDPISTARVWATRRPQHLGGAGAAGRHAPRRHALLPAARRLDRLRSRPARHEPRVHRRRAAASGRHAATGRPRRCASRRPRTASR